MASALTPNGSTWAWRKLRAQWAWRLKYVGAVACRRCDQLVTSDDDWHLGHPEDLPRVLGGDDNDLWPEHAACSKSAGAQLRHRLARQQHSDIAPSRNW